MCQTEVSDYTQYLETDQFPDNIDIYAVSTSVDKSRDNYPPSAWLESAGWPFPTLVDDTSRSAGRAFGLRFFPTTVFVNSDGTVVLRIAGALGIDNLLSVFSQMS